jgi:hypothetical protein
MKRALRTFAFLAGYTLVLSALLYVCAILERGPYIGPVAFLIAISATNLLMVSVLLHYRRETADRWIREEAEKWLVSRGRQRDEASRRRNRRLRRWLPWVPIAVVFPVFLFLPETFGVASHLLEGRSAYLAPYRLYTPITWVFGNKTSSYLWAIASKGIGRVGPTAYWRREQPVSSMVFYSVPYGSRDEQRRFTPPITAKVLSKSLLPFAKGTFTCWDIIPFAYTRRDLPDANFAHIICATPNNDFYASFCGPRADSSAFYQMLRASDEE